MATDPTPVATQLARRGPGPETHRGRQKRLAMTPGNDFFDA
jgi:hypothetical protein